MKKKKLENVDAEIVKYDLEYFENEIDIYLHRFMTENGIEDMKKETQAVWNCCLRYIYSFLFSRRELHKKAISVMNGELCNRYNSYDYDLVYDVLEIYIYQMCMKYDKEVSIMGFSTLTGIDYSTILEWGRNGNNKKLSTKCFKIWEKLNVFNEESLSDKLISGSKNVVGIIAALNRRHGWASPYTADARAQQNLSDAELPQLGTASRERIEQAEPLRITWDNTSESSE